MGVTKTQTLLTLITRPLGKVLLKGINILEQSHQSNPTQYHKTCLIDGFLLDFISAIAVFYINNHHRKL